MGRRVQARTSVIASIVGATGVGSVLTATPDSSLTGTITYQWKRDGVNISGATNQTYTLVTADAGHVITCSVSGLVYTAGPVVAVVVASLTTDPVIDGTPTVGEVLSYTPGTSAGTNAIITQQWFADGQPIAGAEGATLTLTAGLSGKQITVRQTVSNSAAIVSRTSAAVTVGVFDPVPTGSIFLGNLGAIYFGNNALVFA